MNVITEETTLSKMRCHWGIFLMPCIVAMTITTFLVVPPILYWEFLQKLLVAVGSGRLNYPFIASVLRVAVIPGLLSCGFLFLLAWSVYLNSNITLTDRRIVFQSGIFRRLSGEIPLSNVEAVVLAESLLGQACGYSSVIITSAGFTRLTFCYLPSSRRFHLALRTAVSGLKKLEQ